MYPTVDPHMNETLVPCPALLVIAVLKVEGAAIVFMP